MIYIASIILIAVSLSMDAFALALSYGIKNVSIKNVVITAVTVGLFHFFMPFFGSIIGAPLFAYTIIKPRIVLFLVFLLLSIDMFTHFFEEKPKLRELNVIGTLFFAISVSFDSFSVGLGLKYIYDNVLIAVSSFCLISAFFTTLGFFLGKKLSEKIGRYSFLVGSISLFLYSVRILTK